MTIYGDGMQTRSFQYVDDLVSSLYVTIKSIPVNSSPTFHDDVGHGESLNLAL